MITFEVGMLVSDVANSPVPGELLLLCNYTSIMATTTTTISHAFA